jgi:ABC-type antimicrobial peptide transport system permease subunit
MLCALGGGMTRLVIATIAAIVVVDATNAPVVVDYRVLGMGVFAIIALGIAAGLLPALKARRLSTVDAQARWKSRYEPISKRRDFGSSNSFPVTY